MNPQPPVTNSFMIPFLLVMADYCQLNEPPVAPDRFFR